MTFYRLYLLDNSGHIADHESFHAMDDQAAAHVSEIVFDSCHDAYKGLEVWNGPRCIAKCERVDPNNSIARGRKIVAKASDVIAQADKMVEEMAATIEMGLMQGNPKLKNSARLQARLAEIKNGGR